MNQVLDGAEVIAYAKKTRLDENRVGDLTEDDLERARLEMTLEIEVQEFVARRAANPAPEPASDEEAVDIEF